MGASLSLSNFSLSLFRAGWGAAVRKVKVSQHSPPHRRCRNAALAGPAPIAGRRATDCRRGCYSSRPGKIKATWIFDDYICGIRRDKELESVCNNIYFLSRAGFGGRVVNKWPQTIFAQFLFYKREQRSGMRAPRLFVLLWVVNTEDLVLAPLGKMRLTVRKIIFVTALWCWLRWLQHHDKCSGW